MADPSLREQLVKHVDCLAGLIGPRTFRQGTSIPSTIGYITRQWTEMGFHVTQQTYDALGDQATNLIVEIRGVKQPEKIVLLGAHYDTVFSTPGADDNASAVAVLLEVSRLLQSYRPKRTIRFVAFACEEPPYFGMGVMGSQHHAREARHNREQIVGMLCLEMVGYFRNEPNSQSIPPSIPRLIRPFFPKRGNFLAAVGNLQSWKLAWGFRRGYKSGTRHPLFSIVLPESIHEIRLSDNSSFWDQGYSALMLTDTSFLRNPNYHQSTDLPDTLNYDAMTEVALGVTAAMKRLSS